MNAGLKTILGYGALIAAAAFVTLYWPDGANVISSSAGLFGGLVLVAVGACLLWIIGRSVIDRLVDAWRDGYPTALHASRKSPPWKVPRTLSSRGSPKDKADCRLLRKRLTPVPGEFPDAVWRDIPNSTLRNHYFEPALYLDRETGQYWAEYGYEAGHNQWIDIAPVRKPD